MDAAAVAALVERLGLPLVALVAGAVLAWRLGGRLLAALVDAYRERIQGLEADRDHFRARSEAAEDRTDTLCRELIDEARTARKGGSKHGE